MAAALAVRKLVKSYGAVRAVQDVSFEVPQGSICGLLGPNGSGKTTTIRMLLGLIYPTSGEHELLGTPMPAGATTVLPRVGSLVEGPAFHPQLSGRANLARCDAADRTADPATAAGRISAALDRVGLLAAGLILLDLNMPRKDGREVLREIKQHSDLRRIPVVVLTTSRADTDIQSIYELGANSFISKPVQFEGLVSLMRVIGQYWFGTVELPFSK